MAALTSKRYRECAEDPRQFLDEMRKANPGSAEWLSLGGLFVIGCLNRDLELELVEEVAVALAAIDGPRFERLVSIVRKKRSSTK
jgi:hypothetical protein